MVKRQCERNNDYEAIINLSNQNNGLGTGLISENQNDSLFNNNNQTQIEEQPQGIINTVSIDDILNNQN